MKIDNDKRTAIIHEYFGPCCQPMTPRQNCYYIITPAQVDRLVAILVGLEVEPAEQTK